MPLFLKSIDSLIDVFGNEQTLRFNTDQLNNEANLILFNAFTPLVNTSLNTGLAFVNSSLNGFRFKHEFSSTSTVFGNFYLECASRFGGNSSNIFKYDEQSDSLLFFKNVSIPSLGISGNLNLNSNKIINLANGINNNDAVNLGQLNSTLNGVGLASLSTNGFVVRTGPNTFASRSFANGNGISVTNSNGFSGNPTFALTNSFSTSANVTVNWWNSSVSTDVLDYVVSSSITYPIFINAVKSGSSGTNNLRYWQTISGLGDNTGANAYWSLSYYNQAVGANKTYISIGIPQDLIYLNAKVDLQSNIISNLGAPGSAQDAVNKNYADTSTISPTRISNYPSNSLLFLNGLGSWVAPSFSNLINTSAASYAITLNNTNASATDTGFLIQNNGNYGVALGFNNSTNEAYVWAYNTASLKFGTANTKRAQILNNGTFDLLSNDLITTGNVNATTGTLKGNNLAAYNSGSIVVTNPLSMNSNNITGLANPVNNQDAATKLYVDNSGGGTKSILHGYNASTYSTNVAVGDHLKFDSSVFVRGVNITLDTATAYNTSTNTASVGRITLAAGKTYKLTGSINNVVSANYNGMRWYNSDTNTPLGVVSGMSSPISTTDRVSSAGFMAYITTSVSTRVELRIIWNALSSVNGSGDGIGPAWFIVEEV